MHSICAVLQGVDGRVAKEAVEHLGYGAIVCDPFTSFTNIDGSSPKHTSNCVCNIPFEHCAEGTWSFQGL
eukprot:3176446-Prymnesium_polylepis.1